jgi:hypothetical protein
MLLNSDTDLTNRRQHGALPAKFGKMPKDGAAGALGWEPERAVESEAGSTSSTAHLNAIGSLVSEMTRQNPQQRPTIDMIAARVRELGPSVVGRQPPSAGDGDERTPPSLRKHRPPGVAALECLAHQLQSVGSVHRTIPHKLLGVRGAFSAEELQVVAVSKPVTPPN